MSFLLLHPPILGAEKQYNILQQLRRLPQQAAVMSVGLKGHQTADTAYQSASLITNVQ